MVPGEGAAQPFGDAFEHLGERGEGRVGAVVFGEVREPQVAAGAVEDGRDRRAVERADDEVALEVPDLGALIGDRRAQPDHVEPTQRAGLGRFAAGAAVLAAAAGPVQAGVQPAPQAPGAVRVDALVDALVAERRDDPVGPAGELDRDRHRRVLRLQPHLDMRSQGPVRDQLRDLRTRPLRVGSALRRGPRVDATAAVAGDLRVDRAPVTVEPCRDLGVRLAALDPDTDLLALGRGQGPGWHAGESPLVRVVCRQRASCPPSRSDRWRLTFYLTV
jgi:hypothetical protein